MSRYLNGKITGEAAGVLNKDCPRTVAAQIVKQINKAGTFVNRVRTRHSRVVILVDDVKAVLGRVLLN